MSAERAGQPARVSYGFADGVARVRLEDADRGCALDRTTVDQLLDAVLRARADHAAVVVLCSTGRFFSVGGDLAAFGSADDVGRLIDDLADVLHRVVSELQRIDAVVVAAVQGTAAGAGFPLAAAADVVVAAEGAVFALGYGKVGLSVDGGTSQLVHSLGLHRVLALALLHDTLDAAEAQRLGLVARVVPAADLDAEVGALAARLAAGPARAQAATKRLVRDAAEPAPEARLRAEALAIRELSQSPDGREGVRAFLEKRRPSFGG